MNRHQFEISTGIMLRGGTLKIDGVELKGVRRFEFSAGIDEVTTVRIEMIAEQVEAVGDGYIELVEDESEADDDDAG